MKTAGLFGLMCVSIVVLHGAKKPGQEEFERFKSTFGLFTTIAGRGLADRGIQWEPSMEGADALQAELSRPHMTMADKAGNFYIADKENHAIRLVDESGIIHTVAGTNRQGNGPDGLMSGTTVDLNEPNGLYTFDDGLTYILDTGNGKIRRLGSDGMIETVLEDPDGISTGRGLWVGEDQSLIFYASGNRVRCWRRQSGITTLADGFESLGNLDVDLNGHVVVTDRGSHRVYRIFDDGRKQVIAGNGNTKGSGNGTAIGTPLAGVRGIGFLQNGAYLLATHSADQVWYVDTFGGIHLFLDGKGGADPYSGDGLTIGELGKVLSEPRAVTIAPNGDLVVTERDVGFVRVLEKRDPPGPLNLTVDGLGSLSLSWPSDSDDFFVVESIFDLTNPNWTSLARVAGSVSGYAIYRFPVALNLEGMRYFRVLRVLPDPNPSD